jgi:hypothetical protein
MDERRSKHRHRPRSHCAADMQDAVSALEGRWKMMILAHLFGETVMRFSDLQRDPGRIAEDADPAIARLGAGWGDLAYGLPGGAAEGRIPADRHRAGLGPVFLALLEWAELRRGKGQKTEAAE